MANSSGKAAASESSTKKNTQSVTDSGRKTAERLLDSSGQSLDKATAEARERVQDAARNMVNVFELLNLQIKESQATANAVSRVFMKSSEDMNKALTTAGQRMSEIAVKFSKDGLNSRSLPDYLNVQAEAARTLYDTVLTEVTQISDAAIQTGQNVIQPLQKHVVDSAERAVNSLQR